MLRKYKRIVAAFLLLTFITNIFAPTISWALTAGPTAPEATSFEPVDTTDMVNIATGDLVYNIPLLEVPGPAGSYPISLSYHAGILTNEESSMCGLGWNVNPGAIARTVNNYPDDQLGALRQRVDYNSGGERRTFSLGIGTAGVSLGLAVSFDSNIGIGMGSTISIGFGNQETGLGLNPNFSFGSNPHGGMKGDIGLDFIGRAGGQSTYSLGISTNFNSVSFSGGIKDGKHSILGASIDSKGSDFSLSVRGASAYQNNSKAGKATIESMGLSASIPVGVLFINIGYNYTRYYSYELSDVNLIGSLHAKESIGKNRDDWAFDSYVLLDPDQNIERFKSDPEKSQGGSFPAYDNYIVNAQGLNGSIQPYIFTSGNLFRQNLKQQSGNGYLIEHKSTSPSFFTNVNFRFKNDFANSYAYSTGNLQVNADPISGLTSSVIATNQFENAPPIEGYNSNDQHLAGSKHIEWFTNQQIKDGHAKNFGFIDYQHHQNREVLHKFDRDISAQIGGFMITNESGVTYHYALPVYARTEFSKTFMKGKPNDIFQSNSNTYPYAYTWLLTAVTGPDYVDRNENGIVDNLDWGYWVKFNYGKWTDSYNWRNPALGTRSDIDSNTEFYSSGYKELYYLNAIQTKTHTALFEKEIRADSKGVATHFTTDPDSYFGVIPVDRLGFDSYVYSIATLKLNNIYLIDNVALESIAFIDELINKSDVYNHQFDYLSHRVNVHFGQNVLDKFDLSTLYNGNKTIREVLEEKSIRVIAFEHSYDLQDGPGNEGVPNSFDPEGNLYTLNPDPSIAEVKLGKLTLNALHFKGKGNAALIPPMRFSYSKNPAYNMEAYDNWGFYKSDYNEGKSQNETLKRMCTDASSRNTDAWSLTDIITSLGSSIKIEYESDEYNRAALTKAVGFRIKDISNHNSGQLKLTFHETDYESSLNLQRIFTAGSSLQCYAIGYHKRNNGNIYIDDQINCNYPSSCLQAACATAEYFEFETKNALIKEVKEKYIVIEDSELYSKINGQKVTKIYDDVNSSGQRGSYVYCSGNWSVVFYPRVSIRFNGFPDKISGGYVSIGDSNGIPFKGGGIRVKSIGITGLSNEHITLYSYSNGVTSYEPFNFISPVLNPPTAFIWENQEALNAYNLSIWKNFSKLLAIAREVPSPGVIYQFTTIEEAIRKIGDVSLTRIPGKKVFERIVFDSKMVERVRMKGSVLEPVRCLNEFGEEVNCNPIATGDPQTDNTTCYDANDNVVNCVNSYSTSYTPLVLNDFTSWIGALKSVSYYGANDELLRKTVNDYLHDYDNLEQFKGDLKDKFNNQGKISQSFAEYRKVRNDNGSYLSIYVFSMRNEYPLVPLGHTDINYKTGITTSSVNLAFDYYTGAPTKILTDDGYGNKYLNISEPAYKYYSNMGLKVKASNPKDKKHMLDQNAALYMYRVDPNNIDNKLALVSASAQTWANNTDVLKDNSVILVEQPEQFNIWRKQTSYSWRGDDVVDLNAGLYPLENFNPFNFALLSANSDQWQVKNNITLYDAFSHVLEMSDINGNKSATKTSLDNSYVFATAGNSSYNEFAYSGAEDVSENGYYGGAVRKFDGEEVFRSDDFDSTSTHTGLKALRLTTNSQKAFGYSIVTEPKRIYHASVWVNSTSGRLYYKMNGVTKEASLPSDQRKSGKWYLLSVDILTGLQSTTLEIWSGVDGGICNFDDFRICPVDAGMVSYVYNKWGELWYILDNNNLYTRFEYDEMGRLKKTYKETFYQNYGNKGITKVSEVNYNYGPNYLLSIGSSSTGNGSIQPSGSSKVGYGQNISFSLEENCPSNLSYILIDNQVINRSQPIHTLVDGTIVKLIGKNVVFENVRSDHTLKAEFSNVNVPKGTIMCYNHYELTGNGPDCFGYAYAYYDECGNLGPITQVGGWYELPYELREGLDIQQYQCCSMNNNNPECICSSN